MDDRYERRRTVRVDTNRDVTAAFVERGMLLLRDTRMVNVGLGGCAIERALPAGEHVAVLVAKGLFMVGRVMPGGGDPTRIEWSATPEDAAELAREFAIPDE